jgi:hypothetical protein
MRAAFNFIKNLAAVSSMDVSSVCEFRKGGGMISIDIQDETWIAFGSGFKRHSRCGWKNSPDEKEIVSLAGRADLCLNG